MGKIGFVFFADEWGYTKGGINSFNFDLCNALGVADLKKEVEIFCICKNTLSQKQKNKAIENKVTVITLDEHDFDCCNFDGIDFDKLLAGLENCFAVYSVGHDIVTAKQAKAFYDKAISRNLYAKLVLFHHMDYESYYDASNSGQKVKEKLANQANSFKNADYIIAVGPKLYDSIRDKKIDYELDATIGQIIPGMTEIKEIKEIKKRQRVLFVGRIESNNNNVKQYGAVVEAFSRLYKEKMMSDGSCLVLLGINGSSDNDIEKNIKKHANEIYQQYINILGLNFINDREEILNYYRTSSIVIMPSLSEGFGLVALEAISAGTPLIVSKNSGIYDFLEKLKLDNYISSIDISGNYDEEANQVDVDCIYKELKKIVLNYKKYKDDSLKLKKILLKKGFTWAETAKQLFNILDLNEYFKYRFLYSLLPPSFKRIDSFELLKMAKKSLIGNLDIIKLKQKELTSFNFESYNIEEFKVKLQKTNKFSNVDIRQFLKSVIRDFLLSVADYLADNIELNSDNIKALLNFDYDARLSSIFCDALFDEYENTIQIYAINAEIKKHLFFKLFDEEERKIIQKINNVQYNKYRNVDLKGLSKSVSNEKATLIPLNEIYAEVSVKNRKNTEEEYRVGPGFAKKIFSIKKMVLLGDPGTGKSTVFQKVILELCETNNSYGVCCIPIKIADLSIEINKDSINLNNYISSKFFGTDENSINLFQKAKEYGYLFVLLDGYDETKNDGEKERISNFIKFLLNESPNSYYLATSRLVGYNNFFEKNGFSSFEMMPLSRESVEMFIKQWFNVVSFGDMLELNKNNAKGEKLKNLLSADNTLMELSKNPLLLTIIVILQYHGVTPPTDKGKLYEVITETLLQSWIEQKGSLIKDYKIDFLIGLFSEIAYKMIEENYSTLMIDENTLREVCMSCLTNNQVYLFNDSPDVAVDKFIKYVSESVGILLKRGEYSGIPCYSFLIHRQFTEYFAAIKLESKNEDDIFHIEDYVSEPKWVEVLILMFSFMNNQQSGGQKRLNKLIGKLMNINSSRVTHIDDLNYNYQILLKIMINNVAVFENNKILIKQFINELFNNANKYRFSQFIDELLLLFSSDHKDILVDILVNDINYDEMRAFENSVLFISNLYKNNLEKEVNDLVDKIDKKHNLFVKFFERFIIEREGEICFSGNDTALRPFIQHSFCRFISLLDSYDYQDGEYELVLKFICFYSTREKVRGVKLDVPKLLNDITSISKLVNSEKMRQDANRMMLLHYLISDLFVDGKRQKSEAIVQALPECSDVVDCMRNCFKDFRTMASLSIFHSIHGYIFIFSSDKKCTIKIVTIKNDKIILMNKTINNDSAEDIAYFLDSNGLDSSFFMKYIAFGYAYNEENKELSNSIQRWLLSKGILSSVNIRRSDIDFRLLTDDVLIKNYDELLFGFSYKRIRGNSGTPLSSIICKLMIGSGRTLTKAEKKYLDDMYAKYKNTNTIECGVYYDLINKFYNPFSIKQ